MTCQYLPGEQVRGLTLTVYQALVLALALTLPCTLTLALSALTQPWP